MYLRLKSDDKRQRRCRCFVVDVVVVVVVVVIVIIVVVDVVVVATCPYRRFTSDLLFQKKNLIEATKDSSMIRFFKTKFFVKINLETFLTKMAT